MFRIRSLNPLCRVSTFAAGAVFSNVCVFGQPSIVSSGISQSSSPLIFQGRGFHSSTVLLRRMGKGGGRKKFREPKPGDWTCQCGTINFKAKRECFQCNAPAPPLPPGVVRPKMPGEDPNDWACPCGQMNYRGNVNCHKCHMPKPVVPPPPGANTELWKCPKCKNMNRPNRKFCFSCNVAKDAVISGPGSAPAAAASQGGQQQSATGPQ
jgi:hypothetical protein